MALYTIKQQVLYFGIDEIIRVSYYDYQIMSWRQLQEYYSIKHSLTYWKWRIDDGFGDYVFFEDIPKFHDFKHFRKMHISEYSNGLFPGVLITYEKHEDIKHIKPNRL